jgi:Do/DeqQ family serine protease
VIFTLFNFFYITNQKAKRTMKNKVVLAAAIVVASAVVGGLTAYTVGKFNVTGTEEHTETLVESGFESAGNHFTTFSPENYPDFTYAAENAVKGVVGVINTQEIPQQTFGMGGGGFNPFFEFFGIPQEYGPGQPQGQGQRQGDAPRSREQVSGGSGVIISPDGYIVTNHHVVENADKLTVKLYDGKIYDARLIGTDADTEVALIKIEATDLPSIPMGSSDELRLGEWVLAIGNPYELYSTVTHGIVSAKGRSLGAIQTASRMGVESFIQTDAAVNPGNSGGALVNLKGELVGINTLIKSPTGTFTGYSFAVPESIVSKVVADLREYGVVQRALIGIAYSPIDDRFLRERGEELEIEETGGLYVGEVAEGGAAEAAGIKEGDIVTEIDGVTMIDGATVAELISRHRPGDTINISVKRDGKVKQFDVVLRNKAGKSELIAKETFSAIESLGGEFADIDLSNKEKRELGIRGGIQVTAIEENGILARARVRRGYIITQINGTSINSVNELYNITEKITSLEGIYPDGRAIGYSIVPEE